MDEIGKIVGAALSQAPDVASQLVVVERLDCIGWFIVMAVFMVAIVLAWKRCEKLCQEGRGIFRTVLAFLGAGVLIGLVANPINFIATFVAPKAVAVKVILSAIRK